MFMELRFRMKRFIRVWYEGKISILDLTSQLGPAKLFDHAGGLIRRRQRAFQTVVSLIRFGVGWK
jgi:hypothetical protein